MIKAKEIDGELWIKASDHHQAIKESLAQKQEPVATVTSETGNPDITMSWWHEPALPVGTPLYTTPPQRTWVGLTDEDIHNTVGYNETREMYQFALALIAKLKELNT